MRAQPKETEELGRIERLGGEEAVAALELQLSGLTVARAKLEKDRDKLFEIICPGPENLESTQQQQQSQPAWSAAEQLIHGEMGVKQAEMEEAADADCKDGAYFTLGWQQHKRVWSTHF